MTDKIGEMSERIVHTEELMVSTNSDSGTSSLITEPADEAIVNHFVPI